MKRQSSFTLLLFVMLFASSCGNPDIKKLAHRWQVVHAGYYDSVLGASDDSLAIRNYYDQSKAVGQLYKGRIYDLQNNGSYRAEGGLVPGHAGRWELRKDTLFLRAANGETERWYFMEKGPVIYPDSSLRIRLDPTVDRYVSLDLKPAPGETVKPDFE